MSSFKIPQEDGDESQYRSIVVSLRRALDLEGLGWLVDLNLHHRGSKSCRRWLERRFD